MVEPRRRQRLLRAHAEVHHVGDDLALDLCLHMAPLEAHHQHGHSALADHAGHQGVGAAFVRPKAVGMPGVQTEHVSPVLENDAGVLHRHTRAEPHEKALDERDPVAPAVGHRDVFSIPGDRRRSNVRCRSAVREPVPHGRHAPFGQEVQATHGHALAVCEVKLAVGKGAFLGFNEQVQVVGTVVVKRPEVVALQDLEHLQRHESLGRRRQLVDVVAAIGDMDGIDPIRGVVLEIAQSEGATRLLRTTHQLFRHLAAIEELRAPLGDAAHCARQVRLPEHFTRCRRPAVNEITCRGLLVLSQLLLEIAPLVARERTYREALLGVADGGFEKFPQGACTVVFEQGLPAVHRSRHRYRVNAGLGDLPKALRPKGRHIGAVG